MLKNECDWKNKTVTDLYSRRRLNNSRALYTVWYEYR